MRTSANRYVFMPAKACTWLFSVFALSTLLLSCNNDEFHVGSGIVDGEDMEIGETTFPVKGWSIPDPTKDTLSGRVISGLIFKIGDPTLRVNAFYLNLLGHYTVPNVCEVEAGFATQLQISSLLSNFGDIVLDSVCLQMSYTPIQSFADSTTAGFTGYDTNSKIYKGLYPSGYSFYGRNISNTMPIEIYRLDETFPDQYSVVPGTSIQKENYLPLTKKWKTAELIHSESLHISLDTIRSTTEIADSTIIYDDDGVATDTTYKYADSIYPRMVFKMNKQYWQNVLDHFKGQIITQESFQKYFNGLYFKAPKVLGAPFMMLNLSQDTGDEKRGCFIRLYYHTARAEGQTYDFYFRSSLDNTAVSANSIDVALNPKVQAMIENPDTTNGEKDLYIIPFGQTEAVINLIDENTIKTIKDNGWVINDAYVEFTNKAYDQTEGTTPVAELWMYMYPYSDQFIYWDPETGYPTREVSFYIPDEAAFEKEDGQWYYVPRTNYGLNGIVNENSTEATFAKPGKYRMRVTRTLIDAVYGNGKPVKVGLRLPMGVTEKAPNVSILSGENLRLVVKYTKKKTGQQ